MAVAWEPSDESRSEDGSRRDAVRRAGRRWSAHQYELVRVIAELDACGEWTLDDAPSCAHWVAEELDVELCTAREWLRIGRALAELAELDRAFENGELSYSKVRTLTRVADPANEAELCALASRVPASGLRRHIAIWQERREIPEETEARQAAARGLSKRVDVDGCIVGSFRIPPAMSAQVFGPIDAIVRQNQNASAGACGSDQRRWPSIAQQRLDALVECITRGGAPVTTEVVLHVRADGCTLDDGTPVAGSVVERIAPRAFLRALIHDAEGKPINASGRQRHPTTRQKRVVKERHKACVDCGSTEFLEYDHDPPYEQSRHTVVDDLYPRCWPCHYRRRKRWSASGA